MYIYSSDSMLEELAIERNGDFDYWRELIEGEIDPLAYIEDEIYALEFVGPPAPLDFDPNEDIPF